MTSIVFIGPLKTCQSYAIDMVPDQTVIVKDASALDSIHAPVVIYLCPGYLKLPKWPEIKTHIEGLSGKVRIYTLTNVSFL